MVRATSAVIIAALALSPAVAQKRKTPPAIVQTPPPAVIMTPTNRERYGVWTVSPLGDGYSAFTTNASESTFGIFCGTTCVIMFNPRIECKDKSRYPALINAPSGAFNVMLDCRHVAGRYMLFAQFNNMMFEAMEIGGELGIAFPMESGRFEVARFSLTGSLKAATRAYQLAPVGRAGRDDEDDERGLRNQTL